VMIVVVDQVFWRPVVVWCQKYKLEEEAEADVPRSWVLSVLRRSDLYLWIVNRLFRRNMPATVITGPLTAGESGSSPHLVHLAGDARGQWAFVRTAARWVVLTLSAAGVGWGARTLIHLLLGLPLRDTRSNQDWLNVALALLASFVRTSAAVFIGAAWALPVGILIGLSPKWSQRLQPVIQVVASFPAPMVFPLVTLLLVVLHVPFTAGCAALMLLGAQWYILFNVIAGATAIPAELKEVAKVYRMGKWVRWRRLYLPCVFPYFVTGLITATGGAWNATIVSEYVQVKDRTFVAFGLGSTISQATAAGNFSLLCAAVVTMAAFVVLINRVFWKRLYRLAEARYSLNA